VPDTLCFRIVRPCVRPPFTFTPLYVQNERDIIASKVKPATDDQKSCERGSSCTNEGFQPQPNPSYFDQIPNLTYIFLTVGPSSCVGFEGAWFKAPVYRERFWKNHAFLARNAFVRTNRIALSPWCSSVCMSVCLSLCLSGTVVHCDHTVHDTKACPLSTYSQPSYYVYIVVGLYWMKLMNEITPPFVLFYDLYFQLRYTTITVNLNNTILSSLQVIKVFWP